MYAAAGVRSAPGDAAAALERLNFERRFGGQPSPDVDGALVAMAHQMRLLAASILLPLGGRQPAHRSATPDAPGRSGVRKDRAHEVPPTLTQWLPGA
jgi:hypothetical protein